MSVAVAVIGAAGRMGSEVCRAVEAADDLRLVGRFDLGDELGDLGERPGRSRVLRSGRLR